MLRRPSVISYVVAPSPAGRGFIKGNQGLLELAKAVREALDSAGILYDRKGFLPQRVKSANKRVNLT